MGNFAFTYGEPAREWLNDEPAARAQARARRRKRRKYRVKEPLTEELLCELLESPSPEQFTSTHNLQAPTLSEYLQWLLANHGLVRSKVIREAGLNETFGWQIFKGERGCGRDKALALAFAMNLDLRETNRLLQAAGQSALYCKDRRDAIIIFCIEKGLTLQRTDEELYRFGEQTICQ